MPTLLQINVTANWGSTGKIAEDIGRLAISRGWNSVIAYGRGNPTSDSQLIRIGNDVDMRLPGLYTRVFDNHGLASKSVTKKFIDQIKKLKPDLIHLHNIHGYYINYPELFSYLKEWGGPVVWTLHDCWIYTGHCAHYRFSGCNKWKTECHNCRELHSYPASFVFDRSLQNHRDKKKAFLNMPNLTLVPVSEWLREEISESFMKDYRSVTIHNGINLNTFRLLKNTNKSSSKYIILGVASVWTERKGLDEFVKLRHILPEKFHIKLVGLNEAQIKKLPEGIEGITRTENVEQLVELYNQADVFVNPTFEDNFPTTNIEALACGTPVVTYDTGGSPEAIDSKTGVKVAYGDIEYLSKKIIYACTKHPFSSSDCRARAEQLYNKDNVFPKYLDLYESLI